MGDGITMSSDGRGICRLIVDTTDPHLVVHKAGTELFFDSEDGNSFHVRVGARKWLRLIKGTQATLVRPMTGVGLRAVVAPAPVQTPVSVQPPVAKSLTAPKLGELPAADDMRRDAVHVAIASVVAKVELEPGCYVGLDEEGRAEISSTKDCIGVVDPFLHTNVQPGQRFWLCLCPDTITGLRHVWTHPSFKAKVPGKGT